MLFGDHFKKIIKRRIKMNKFILSIMLSLTVIGCVNADVTINNISASNGKVKIKKADNKNKTEN